MENPYLTGVRHDHQVLITLVLLALLGAVFLEGFLQAIGVAVALAGVYLALNVVVVITRLWHVLTAEHVVTGWPSAPTAQHSGVLVMVGAALLVFVCTLLGFLVTWISDAGIDRQRGAYATGVLVLISSAAIAVTISAHQRGRRAWTAVFAVISTVFLYTTAANVVERPDGVRIGGCFIAGIIPVSPLSRLARAVELRVTGVTLDPLAERFASGTSPAGPSGSSPTCPVTGTGPPVMTRSSGSATTTVCPAPRTASSSRSRSPTPPSSRRACASTAASCTTVTVCSPWSPPRSPTPWPPCCCTSATPPAASRTSTSVDRGQPLPQCPALLPLRQGEVATAARQVLREAEPDPARRPRVHTG